MKKDIRNYKKSEQAFTLLEVMIAVSIFGLLLLYASQFMRSEINAFESVSRQSEVEQKARIAMMHILDEVRLHKIANYSANSDSQEISYYPLDAPETPESLIFINLQTTTVPSPSAKVFFDKEQGKLWYRENGSEYLIADEISQLSIEGDPFLVKIKIKVGENHGSQPFELQTWIRLD